MDKDKLINLIIEYGDAKQNSGYYSDDSEEQREAQDKAEELLNKIKEQLND
jgi:hypothetical protein